MRRITCIVLIAAALPAARAQQLPPIRLLGRIEHVTTEPLRAATTAVALSDGRVYVNDVANRRVLLFDSTLSHAQPVADSTSVTSKAYGARPGTLFAFRGDSAVFVDLASASMLVLGPDARIDRVIAMPRPTSGPPFLFDALSGLPGFDAHGRLISLMNVVVPPPPAPEPGETTVQRSSDSTLLVAFDLVSRTIDTIASVRNGSIRLAIARDANGDITSRTVTQTLLAVVDAWVTEHDGTVAVVRGRDFHVDRLGAGGQWRAAPKVPFPWERLTDDQKTAFIDSSMAAMKAQRDSMAAAVALRGPPPAADGTGARGGRGGGGGGAVPPPVVIDGRPALSELPDYKPAFLRAAARADADGNLWIKTTTMDHGQPVYYIVNASGALVDRIQLPAFRTIAGFGPGVVYLSVVDADKVVHLERAAIKRK